MSQFQILSGKLISPPEPRRPAVQLSSETSAEYFERRAQEGLAYAAAVEDPRCRGKAWVKPISVRQMYRRFYQLGERVSGQAPSAA